MTNSLTTPRHLHDDDDDDEEDEEREYVINVKAIKQHSALFHDRILATMLTAFGGGGACFRLCLIAR